MQSLPVWWLLVLGAQHWLFDWVLQTRYMADNKSKNWLALSYHVAVVTLGLFLVGEILGWTGTVSYQTVYVWGLLNGALHFATDAVTSRMTSRLYNSKRFHAFFTTIGADQWLLHFPALVLTSSLMLRFG